MVSSYLGSSPLTFHFIIVRTSFFKGMALISAGVNSCLHLKFRFYGDVRPAKSLSSFISTIRSAARSALVTESLTAICLPTSPTVMPAIWTILSTRLCALSAFSFHLPSLFAHIQDIGKLIPCLPELQCIEICLAHKIIRSLFALIIGRFFSSTFRSRISLKASSAVFSQSFGVLRAACTLIVATRWSNLSSALSASLPAF